MTFAGNTQAALNLIADHKSGKAPITYEQAREVAQYLALTDQELFKQLFPRAWVDVLLIRYAQQLMNQCFQKGMFKVCKNGL